MAKALGTLIFRGMVGMMSIAATAVITVLVQRYLYEKTGTPALILAPPTSSTPQPAQTQTGDRLPQPEAQSSPPGSSPAETGTSTSTELERQGDRPTRIMDRFWDKLNH